MAKGVKSDLTGKRFGYLKVISLAGSNASGSLVWFCECLCGNTTTYTTSQLNAKQVTSCGCKRRSPKDLTGQKFGRLTVIDMYTNRIPGDRVKWNTICECGNKYVATSKTLVNGTCKSCGCLSRENTINRSYKDGRSKEKLYVIYLAMKKRCHSEGDSQYKFYGAKGIKVCRAWFKDYTKFKKWALKNGYNDNMTIYRKNTKKGYKPRNCEIKEKGTVYNRPNKITITYKRHTHTLKEWERILNLKPGILHSRLKHGFTGIEALHGRRFRKKD